MEIRRNASLAAILTTALDRALYRSEAEKKLWMERKGEFLNAASAAMATDEWRHKIRTLAGLSRGLRGEIPSWARRTLRYGITTPGGVAAR